ncbi:MAG: hypothetical protein IKS76_06560 [Paludibacteraceae bacterium]|nr:hypothetical protein [Paludibacteraceae bacterium]MBR6493226.1 hypothetical protein [Paludibacteraceae bacterium]
MKGLRTYIITTVLLISALAWADDVRKPDFQIADNTFFDPTQKKTEEAYHFGMEYRLELGYVQHEQRTQELSYPQLFLHGARIGATFTFLLPLHFAMHTGLLYTITYGTNEQHWRSMTAQSVQEEIITHKVLEHNLTVPVRVYYTIPLWKQLNLFFYTGPQLQIGIAETDYMETDLSEGTEAWLRSQGIPTEKYDRMKTDRTRANIQWGLGGGLEWDRYRLQSGYDFGLNNMARTMDGYKRYMAEWGWFVSFCYRF